MATVFFWDTKTTTGQYSEEPTFKLLDVIEEKR